jgi:hypothetical protein
MQGRDHRCHITRAGHGRWTQSRRREDGSAPPPAVAGQAAMPHREQRIIDRREAMPGHRGIAPSASEPRRSNGRLRRATPGRGVGERAGSRGGHPNSRRAPSQSPAARCPGGASRSSYRKVTMAAGSWHKATSVCLGTGNAESRRPGLATVDAYDRSCTIHYLRPGGTLPERRSQRRTRPSDAPGLTRCRRSWPCRPMTSPGRR